MRKTGFVIGALVLSLAAGATYASTVLGLSVEDQTRLSKLVVIGEVVSLKGIDDPENGIETAVTLRVIETLKGKAAAGQTVVFHTRRGTVGGVVSDALGEAEFHVGQKALVFVEDVGGTLYNLGLSMGVWNVQERDGAAVSFTRAITDDLEVAGDTPIELGPVDYRTMSSRVTWATRHPQFDNLMLRENFGQGR
ncbi:MAG TPA: hypothetical protein VJS92_16150 [Candidatus Polarisedimenticolaceae bacterium]|nr:hypothetical protein [Candidatus Polarisedimenticolaceae bacterium]